MKHTLKRSFAFLMALLLAFSLLPGIQLTADAATVDYQYGSTDKYTNVIKNWGTREEIATFLSPNAEKFYKDTTYEELIVLDGSSINDDVPSSALYAALNKLMADTHKTNNYDDTKDLFQFTDCQNNGSPSNKISAFYSGEEVGPAWDKGSTWNREHTWPNSKGGDDDNDGGGVNERDIMMLRPETSSNNSSRGNKAYGQSSSYYDPNDESNGKHNLHGDVARIVLYVYVRWGTYEQDVLEKMWGASGVMESKEVLLDWMEEDPVDTWEMGRNDSVESITGTRNVFVDYPELAFALFEEEIPDMVTPSGKAGGMSYTITANSNNTAYGTVSLNGNVITATPKAGYEVSGYQVTSGTANVTRNGDRFFVSASSDCTIVINFAKAASFTVQIKENGALKASTSVQSGMSYTLPAFSGTLPEDYTFCGWTKDTVTGAKPTLYQAGAQVQITANTTFYAVASYFDGDSGSTDINWVLVTSASQIGAGDQVIIAAKDYNYALSTEQKTNNRGAAAITKTESGITYESSVAVLTLESGTVSGTYAFNTGSGYLYAASSSGNHLKTKSVKDDNGSFGITISADGTASVISKGTFSRNTMQYNPNNGSPLFACYGSASQKALSLYVAESAGGATVYTTNWESLECTHANTTTVTVPASCTVNGSVTVTCDDCHEVVSTKVLYAAHDEIGTWVPPTLSQQGYTLLTCSVCGIELPKEDIKNPLTDVAAWSLTLGSDVAVNFKINVDESIRSTAKIHITVAQSTTIYDVAALTVNNDGSYYVSVKVMAPQMTETIKVQIINGTDKSVEKTYTVKEYADTIFGGDYPETTKQLVAQMLHYGAAAQTYFGYNTGDLANVNAPGYASVTPETNHAITASGKLEGIRFYGASLVFRNRIAIRYYFEVSGNIGDYTFAVNGKTCTPVEKGNYYYVEYAEINPQELDKVMTVKVNDTYAVNYSPMNYIVNRYQKGSDSMETMMLALYNYHLAAQAYLAA